MPNRGLRCGWARPSRPVSRVLSRMVIYLGRQLPAASGDLTRERSGPLHCSPIRSCSGWGLPSRRIALAAGELLPHLSTLTGGIGAAGGLFLWHFPWGRPHWALPSTLPCGARTFLRPRLRAGTRDHPAYSVSRLFRANPGATSYSSMPHAGASIRTSLWTL